MFINDTSEKFIAGVIDTAEQFIFPPCCWKKSLKIIAGVNDTTEKLFTGVADTADKFFGSVSDTGD